MIGASCFLNAKFETSQLWGSAFIVLGAVVASSGYMYASDPTSGGSEQSSSGAVDVPSTSGVSAAVAAAVVLYFISVIPSAMSNIYKEGKMKEQDMSEVHTSTVVSFWQLWFGFLFLPLMSLPQLGEAALSVVVCALLCCLQFVLLCAGQPLANQHNLSNHGPAVPPAANPLHAQAVLIH